MPEEGLTRRQRFAKRSLDLAIAVPALVVSSPLIALAVVVATIETRQWGIFSQNRIGREGRPFRLHKIRTMRGDVHIRTNVTSRLDPRITWSGRLFRTMKIDELPQLFNVVRGDMSLVGQRPDVEGFADILEGADRVVLSVRPGITGPATIAYRHEEALLASIDDPEHYNATVIWPDKVRINRAYVEHYSLVGDAQLLLRTVASVLGPRRHS